VARCAMITGMKERIHSPMRRMTVASVERSPRFCVLFIQTCQARPIGAMPAKYLKKPLLRFETISDRCVRRTSLILLKTTPGLRLPRLEIPGASVNEPAHADVHCHTQRQEREQHRRSTVTH
jgi:hypothetical protein